MLRLGLYLYLALFGGWMVYMWVSAHPHAFDTAETHKPNKLEQHLLSEKQSPAAPAPVKADAVPPPATPTARKRPQENPPAWLADNQQSSATPVPQGRPLYTPPVYTRPIYTSPVYTPPVYAASAPQEAAGILGPGDWPHVYSMLLAANRQGHANLWWSNTQNGHRGMVVLTGAAADFSGCRQFRITRVADSESGMAQVAHVDVCHDGRIR